jgi:hypothetical protein
MHVAAAYHIEMARQLATHQVAVSSTVAFQVDVVGEMLGEFQE